MDTVLYFSERLSRKSSNWPRTPKKALTVERLRLFGTYPLNHPTIIERGQDGEPVLARMQVWVDVETGVLWRLLAMESPKPERRVHIQLYGVDSHQVYEMLEHTLRVHMKVWEDELARRRRFDASYPRAIPFFRSVSGPNRSDSS